MPLLFHKRWEEGLYEKHGSKLDVLDQKYPDEIFTFWYYCPGEDVSSNNNPSYMYGYKVDYSSGTRHSIGNVCELLPDWSRMGIDLHNISIDSYHISDSYLCLYCAKFTHVPVPKNKITP